MDTRIQFRVDEDAKRLVQRKYESHDHWLCEQVNTAFKRLDSGDAVFVSDQDAKTQMAKRKEAIRNKQKSPSAFATGAFFNIQSQYS